MLTGLVEFINICQLLPHVECRCSWLALLLCLQGMLSGLFCVFSHLSANLSHCFHFAAANSHWSTNEVLCCYRHLQLTHPVNADGVTEGTFRTILTVLW